MPTESNKFVPAFEKGSRRGPVNYRWRNPTSLPGRLIKQVQWWMESVHTQIGMIRWEQSTCFFEEGKHPSKRDLEGVSKPGDKGDSSDLMSRICRELSTNFPLSLCLRKRITLLQVGRWGFSHRLITDEEIQKMWD